MALLGFFSLFLPMAVGEPGWTQACDDGTPTPEVVVYGFENGWSETGALWKGFLPEYFWTKVADLPVVFTAAVLSRFDEEIWAFTKPGEPTCSQCLYKINATTGNSSKIAQVFNGDRWNDTVSVNAMTEIDENRLLIHDQRGGVYVLHKANAKAFFMADLYEKSEAWFPNWKDTSLMWINNKMVASTVDKVLDFTNVEKADQSGYDYVADVQPKALRSAMSTCNVSKTGLGSTWAFDGAFTLDFNKSLILGKVSGAPSEMAVAVYDDDINTMKYLYSYGNISMGFHFITGRKAAPGELPTTTTTTTATTTQTNTTTTTLTTTTTTLTTTTTTTLTTTSTTTTTLTTTSTTTTTLTITSTTTTTLTTTSTTTAALQRGSDEVEIAAAFGYSTFGRVVLAAVFSFW